MSTSNVILKYMIKKTLNLFKSTKISLFSRSFINIKSNQKQKNRTLQHNKSKFKNTYRIREITVKDKM